LAAACALLPAAAAASGGSSLDMKFEYFRDANKVWNATPCLLLKKALDRKWTFGWEQEFDVVTGASRRLGADKIGPFAGNEVDAISSASKVENRHSEAPSLTYSHRGVTASGSLYTSHEPDYVSWSPAGSFSMDFFDRNLTLGASVSRFFDEFRPFGRFAGMGGKKNIQSYGATAAQSLTPLTLVGATATLIKSDGYLGHPYNPPADSAGTLLDENLPGRKTAGAFAAQLVQGYHLGGLLGSLNLDARKYQDTWGMKSSTVDVKLQQYVVEGTYVRLRLRFYDQTGTQFAKPYYTGLEKYRTGDIRWYPFRSWLVGGKISSAFPESWGESVFLPDRWDLKFDYQFRNTRGDAVGDVPGMPRSLTYQLYEPDEFYKQTVLMAGLTFDL
jgi:hypothetical protein